MRGEVERFAEKNLSLLDGGFAQSFYRIAHFGLARAHAGPHAQTGGGQIGPRRLERARRR